MKDSTDIINETLGVVEEVTNPVVKKEPVVVPVGNDDIDKDYAYQRQNFYSLVERGQDAIDGILDLCKETEHPRAYEVAGQLIKTVGDTAEKLLDLQKKMKDLNNENEGVKTQHNHLYVGSTSELQKFLKKEKNKK